MASSQTSTVALNLIHKFNKIILNPVIYLMFVLALLIFLYGVFEYAKDSTSSDAREIGRRHMIWGLVGMFIMLSAFGIIKVIMGTFGISNAGVTEIIP